MPICTNDNDNNDDDDNNNNYEYIARALNPSVSNLPEAQSAVNVQLKLSILHIQLTKQTKKPATSKNKQTNKRTNK